QVVADIAVLRSFPSQMSAGPAHAALTARVEQEFIENRLPFQIIYESQLSELDRYRILVLAGCVALSGESLNLIQQFVRSGGQLCLVGEAGLFDEWMNPRPGDPFAGLPADRVFRAAMNDNFLESFRERYEPLLSLAVDAPLGLCAELLDQPGRRSIHLVNYKTPEVMKNIAVRVRLPRDQQAATVKITGLLREPDRSVPFEMKDGMLIFEVPEIETYAIAWIQLR
ncbi:MAG TPA: hypothetical protein PK360_16485, partial [bacterium]|nr:hypothetical protein [bacterium]